MKRRYFAVLPCIAVLILVTVFHYHNLKLYYETILETTGLYYQELKSSVKEENDRAIKNDKEYQQLLSEEAADDETAQLTDDNASVEDTTLSTELTPPESPKLHALSALLLDSENNRVLYEKNGYDKMPMASTTKIMTCIVALENSKPEEIVDVSSYAAKMPDVQLNIRAGEQYYLGDLLYSLMLESHNDVAVAIAEHVGGSVEGFARMMTEKARELGCENTNFVTPNGLDAPEHYTTARDLAVIASYAIKNEDFIKITNTPAYTFSEIKKGRSHSVSNKNRFLSMMEGAIGVKTGFTGEAGYCFVGAIKRLDRTLISVVLGCGWPPRKSLKWSDTMELMSYGIDHYRVRQIFEDIPLEPLAVVKGQQKYVPIDIQGDLKLLLREDEAVRIKYNIPDNLKAPVKANSVIGNADYYINDRWYASVPIYALLDNPRIDFPFCMKRLLVLWSGRYQHITD